MYEIRIKSAHLIAMWWSLKECIPHSDKPNPLIECMDYVSVKQKQTTKEYKFKVDNDTIHLSPIFKWFAKDFLKTYGTKASFAGYKGDKAAVLGFIVKHLGEDDKKWLKDDKRKRINYLKYDWSLNERKLKK